MTDKMLSIQLSNLEKDNLISRTQFGKKPPYRVEYGLTDLDQTLIPVIQEITHWGIKYAEEYGELKDWK